MNDRPEGAILVLPTATAGQQGPVGAWVSTAGWATATRRVVGDVWIVTPAGLMSVEDVRFQIETATVKRETARMAVAVRR